MLYLRLKLSAEIELVWGSFQERGPLFGWFSLISPNDIQKIKHRDKIKFNFLWIMEHKSRFHYFKENSVITELDHCRRCLPWTNFFTDRALRENICYSQREMYLHSNNQWHWRKKKHILMIGKIRKKCNRFKKDIQIDVNMSHENIRNRSENSI